MQPEITSGINIAFSNGDEVGAGRGGTNSRKLLARRVRRYCDS